MYIVDSYLFAYSIPAVYTECSVCLWFAVRLVWRFYAGKYVCALQKQLAVGLEINLLCVIYIGT